MADSSFIGRRLSQGTVAVEPGRLRFFAQAVGDAVDRIERKAMEAVPELTHVDLEAD